MNDSQNLNIKEYINKNIDLNDFDEHFYINDKFIDDYFSDNSLIQIKNVSFPNLKNYSHYKEQLYDNVDEKLERLTYINPNNIKPE